jgi:hypothetical protein
MKREPSYWKIFIERTTDRESLVENESQEKPYQHFKVRNVYSSKKQVQHFGT